MDFKREQKRLISDFLAGKAPDFLKAHAGLVDAYLRESYENSTLGPGMRLEKNPFALVALGGYGREEQCILSDVDLLILFGGPVPSETDRLVEEMIYPLWDIGMEVGHATRSLAECVSLAGTDAEVLISLLDARFITGMSPLYTSLMEQLQERIIRKQAKAIIDRIVEDSLTRHARFGDSAYLLEPNLKDGQGGLRDYHAMRWVARIRSNLMQFDDFLYHEYLSHDEMQELRSALGFIWYVRNHLHHLTGRRNDQLHFELQIRLAKALGFESATGQKPVERFLGELHGQMERVKQQHLMFLYELGYLTQPKAPAGPRRQVRVAGLMLEHGRMLSFASPEAILGAPILLMRIFEESARLHIPLSAEAKRLVKEFGFLVDEGFRTAGPTIRSFERILLEPAPTFNVLNEMLNTGLIVRLIPEIKRIVDRIQYNEYHLYPVDKHSLRAIQAIKSFDASEGHPAEPIYAQIYSELEHPALLLWGALLHDIGKGAANSDHAQRGSEMALDIMGRMGFGKKEIETVSFLVAEHLLLVKTATRRDINDERVAVVCAEKIQTPERAKMLYLLTVADSIATGPKAWSDWTAALLKAFFLKVLNVLERGELASPEAARQVEDKRVRALATASSGKDRDAMEALMDVMSPRYLIHVSVQEMLGHIRLYRGLQDRPFVWEVSRSSGSDTRMVTICAKDRPGLFSRIAGAFTLNNVNILGVQVFTWRNNIALDMFEVTPPPDRIFEDDSWSRAEADLTSALSGELDLASALKQKMVYRRTPMHFPATRPPQVIIDNGSSSFFTIIDVYTYDYPGLLFSITDALFKCELDIWIAKIATKVDQVVDVFYVRDYDGEKVDAPDQVEAIKTAIEHVLPGFDTG